MKSVKHILARKGNNVTAVPADTTVFNVLKLMAEKNIGSVVVTENGRYMGLMTERDYSRKIILMGKHSDENHRWRDHKYQFPEDHPRIIS
ncbi:CBS domain-containing protein [Mucilaginibacter sp. P25]|uniref:CBS domain-containing protein n=1 Tax=Mucilaginibacter sp. P25 TaxID=3423945 RepID=UPI003D7AB43B